MTATSDGDAIMLFEQALDVPGADRWPFDLARVQLLFGERLRRARAKTRSRQLLTAAHDCFERLDARPWTQRAGNELRATGLTIGKTDLLGPASLTPQQLEIAQLAAEGLTNKEIGERLFLSHRTVGTHLYQIFPKLGITSRAALRDALQDRVSDT
jgi:DNA-binding NarL/FixJ family response regulator